MATACNHPAALPCVQSVDYRGFNVRGPKCDLPFRPGTKFNLGVTKRRDPKKKQVRIAIEGSADGLKGELWIVDAHGDQLVSRRSAQLNKKYAAPLSTNQSVFCKVWPEQCLFCKEEREASEREGATQREATESPENDPSEERVQAECALLSRIRQLEREAAESERKLAAAFQENDARVAKNTQLASTIQSLEEKLGERKKAAKEAADREAALVEQRAALEKELDALKSKLSNEKARSSSLQRQVADHEKAARESKKAAIERERKLAAVQRENAAFVEQRKQLDAEIAALKLAVEKQAGAADELAAANEKLENAEKANAACTEQNEQLAAALEQQEAASEAAAAEKWALESEMEALLSRIAELEQPAEEWAPADDRLPGAFGAMRAAGFLTDFRLVVDGEKILVHRPVLAQKSAFFDSLFRSQPAVAEYSIDGVSRETVERMVDFVYGNRLLGLKKDAAELYAAARRFQIASLIAECSRVLKAGISSENAVALLALAARHDDHELAAAVVEFVEANGGKFRLLSAIPPQAFKDDRETFKKILKWLNHEGADGRSDGQQPPQSLDSTASSEVERSDAQ